jgi:hypothetical protein
LPFTKQLNIGKRAKMTNPSQNPPPEPSNRQNLWVRLRRIARHPATLVIGVSVVAIAAVGYAGLRYLIYQRLSSLLEAQLSKILKRPVNVGEVESLAWTLNSFRIGASSVPATSTDLTGLSLQSVEVSFNPFPVLFGQPLPIELAIASPDAYLVQNKAGEWTDLELEKGEELPIDLDVIIRIQDGDIVLNPQGTTAPITIKNNGEARYIDTEQQQIRYDIDATILNSQVNVKGETVLETGKTQAELAVKKLALAEIVALIPNSPIKLNKGQLDANLNFDLPSVDEVEKSSGQGNLNFQQIEAKIESIKAPLRVNLALNLQGQKVFIEQARASLGKVVDTRMTGEIDWEKGLNLNVRVNPVNLAHLFPTISVKLPIKVDGEVQANLQLRGQVEKPIVTGTISNTKPLLIEKTRLRQVNTLFQADLEQIVLKNLQIRPSAGGEIIGSGRLETGIGKALEEDKPITDLAKMPLLLNVRAQLLTEEVLAPYYRFPQDVTVGTLTAQGQVRGTLDKPVGFLKWQAPRAGVTRNVDVSGTGEVLLAGDNIVIRNTVLRTDEGTAFISGNGNLETKKWQTQVRANSFELTPFLAPICTDNPSNYCAYAVAKNLILESANVLLSGRLDSFNLNTLAGIANLTVRAEEGLISLRSELSKGLIEAFVTASQFSLNPFLPNLSAPVNLRQTRVNLSGALEDLLQGSTVAARNFKADVAALLDVADGVVAASGELDNGIVEVVATTGQVSLTKLLPNLKLPTQIQGSQVNLTGNLVSLLASLDSTSDFSSFRATANVRLGVANGIVTAIAQLDNNLWQTDILANDLNTSQILDRLQPNLKSGKIGNLDGLVSLSGSITPLFQTNANLPIQAKTIALRLEDQTLNLNANGTILVSNLFSAPDIASNLDVKANSKLDRLPMEQLVAQIPVRRSLLPQQLDVMGDGQFQGRFLAQNLLTAPTAPGNLLLTGNLRLLDFTLNDRPFDPVLSGPVTVAPGQEIALNLRGQDDIIAANLDPCTRRNCRAPYLVSSFQIRQTTEDLPSIIAQGRQIGERLVAQVENFPLELLKIVPAAEYGILGTLEGQLSANLDINLFTLTGRGDIAIDEPRIGARKARSFNASFTYENNIAQLNTAVLQLEKGRYEGEGALNLASGAISAKFQAERGYVQDILTALQIYDIESLINFWQFKRPDYATAEQVPTKPLGNANAALAEQINLLWEIDKKIRALAAQREAGGAPTELEIRGVFDTTITVAGTLKNPQVNFQFQGDNWEWHPDPTFAKIVKPLGLVIADTQIVPIDEIVLQGSLQNGIVRIEPARVKIRDSLVTFTGGLRTANLTLQPSELVVENLSVDTVNSFVKVPADVAGNLKAKAVLSGKLLNPTIQGEYRFTDAAFNGRVIDRPLAGTFNYTNARLETRTTNDSVIQLYASVPYPTEPGVNDQLALDVRLGTDALTLMDVFTQGQVSWLGGEGEVRLKANGRLDLSDGFRLYGLTANGRVILADATLQSAAFPEPLQVNAQIALNDQLLQVEQLEGTFAQSRLTATGVLPLFIPLSRRDPNGKNPLTIAIEQGQIDLENLYQGGIDARVTVTGAAISPAIGGDVRLSNGQVFVPQQQQANNTPATPIINQPTSRRRNDAVVVPRLENLRVFLEGLSGSAPLYQFDFGGALTLNGPLNPLSNVQSEGVITLDRGRVSFLETRFLLDRRYRNVIVFDREQGLLNPDLSIRMRTLVSEFPQARRQRIEQNNEIPDDSFSRVQRIDITLSIEGQLSQLGPNLGRDVADVCQIQPASAPPIPRQTAISQEELNRLETCLQILAVRRRDGSDVQLLSNPVVKLSSSPPRTQGEIVRLLSEQFFALADVLQSQNSEQLLQYGLVQLALPLLLQSVVYDIENTVGNAVGAADLRLFPVIESNYRVGNNSFLGFSYDYTFNEFKVEYETRF